MLTTANVEGSVIKLVPGGAQSLAHLSDAEVLANTRRLTGTSNKLFAALLLHLAEVETRGIHRTRSCASLYTYCIYELRMSEDAAARRSSAARLVKAFPALFDAIAAGALHLTGLLMLGPHLTPENHVEVLGRAKFRTKKEIAKLVRELHPLPAVPDQMEPIGPDLPRAVRAPTWAQFVESFCTTVRELPEEDRVEAEHGFAAEQAEREASEFAAPARGEREPAPITGPQRYRVEFCASEEHVRLVEQAKALLARTSPGAALGELHERAMRLLVERLEKEKFALTERARTGAEANGGAKPKTNANADAEAKAQTNGKAGANGKAKAQVNGKVRARGDARADANANSGAQDWSESSGTPRRRGRSVPAVVRREVYVRDGGRCAYVDERGERCRETRYLELHHERPFARGGEHTADNLALRCAAHNALAAEEDFGRDVIERERHSARHESLACQGQGSGWRGSQAHRTDRRWLD